MKKITLPLVIASLMALSACSSMRFHKPITFIPPSASPSQKTLANGDKVKVGAVRPTVSWHCKEVNTVFYDWKKINSETSATVTPYAVLTQKALTYANANQFKFNYIFIDMPTKAHPATTANTFYYQCQKVRIK